MQFEKAVGRSVVKAHTKTNQRLHGVKRVHNGKLCLQLGPEHFG